jgi:hypothetical protein
MNRMLEPPAWADGPQRRLIVTHDEGAAPPIELAAALRPLGQLTFTVQAAEPLRPLLANWAGFATRWNGSGRCVRLLARRCSR